ncbi:hypothetical protein CN918_26930 [Priestia megaterium]|nr:hypothetical protein CN918_26930 [Priestia megaterium]
MKIIFALVAIGMLGYVGRRVERKWRTRYKAQRYAEQARQTTQELLNELRKLLKYDENGYKKETYECIKDFNHRVQTCMNNVFDVEKHSTSQLTMEALQKEYKELGVRMKNAHIEIDNLVKTIEERVKYIRDYLSQTNFYPHHFAIDNNKLSGMIVEINERKNVNPFIQLDGYREFSDTLYNQVITFQTQHKEVVTLIEHIDAKKDTYPQNKQNRMMEIKNELYITLHKGEMEKSKKVLQELKNIVKS